MNELYQQRFTFAAELQIAMDLAQNLNPISDHAVYE